MSRERGGQLDWARVGGMLRMALSGIRGFVASDASANRAEAGTSPRSSTQAHQDTVCCGSRRRLKSPLGGSSSGPKRVALHGGGDGRLIGHGRQKGSNPGGWVSKG